MNIFKILLYIILVLLVIILFIFWKGSFSRASVKMEILGPTDIVAGQETEFTVKFKNNSNVRLDQPRLTISFPAHSVVSGELPRVIVKDPEEIGYVYPGEEKSYAIKARIFGAEGDLKDIEAMLTYQPKGLSARYPSKTKLTVFVKTAPISFEFDSQSKIEAGKTIKISLNYFSNIEYPLSNIGVEADYPENFEFQKSDPPGETNNTWKIDNLNKGAGGKIQIYGTLSGDIGAEKLFKAKLGFWHDGEFVVIKKAEFGIGLQEPSIEISQSVNGSSKYGANLGEKLNYIVRFRNVGAEAYENLFLAVRLRGDLFDLNSLEAEKGDMTTSSGTILWDGTKISELKILASGEEGEIRFFVNLKRDVPKDFSNPTLIDKVVIGPTQKEFITRINTRIEASQRAVIGDDIFLSEGPLPFRPGQKSLVTIFWDIKNYFNDVENVRIKSVLPDNAEFLGDVSPASEQDKFIFDSQSRELLWKAGDVAAQTGFNNKNKFIAFQLAITPEGGQKDTFPVLLQNTKLFGRDKWTEQDIEINVGNLDTSKLPEDQGRVQ